MAGKKIRIGIIGTGNWTETAHIPAFRENADVAEVVALCDENLERAQRVARKFDITAVYNDLEEMIGKEQLAKMKKTACLINTARGPVVDSEALAEALKQGQIAGAAVDVFEMEPPVPEDHVLFDAPNLIATPHVAFASAQAFEKRAVIVCENIKKWLDGAPQNVM